MEKRASAALPHGRSHPRSAAAHFRSRRSRIFSALGGVPVFSAQGRSVWFLVTPTDMRPSSGPRSRTFGRPPPWLDGAPIPGSMAPRSLARWRPDPWLDGAPIPGSMAPRAPPRSWRRNGRGLAKARRALTLRRGEHPGNARLQRARRNLRRADPGAATGRRWRSRRGPPVVTGPMVGVDGTRMIGN
jgi:hypothetical protein